MGSRSEIGVGSNSSGGMARSNSTYSIVVPQAPRPDSISKTRIKFFIGASS